MSSSLTALEQLPFNLIAVGKHLGANSNLKNLKTSRLIKLKNKLMNSFKNK